MFEQVKRKPQRHCPLRGARRRLLLIHHVRLRPQVFNSRRAATIDPQCDHCNRILYFVLAAAGGGDDRRRHPVSEVTSHIVVHRWGARETGPAATACESRTSTGRWWKLSVEIRRVTNNVANARTCSPRSNGRARTATARCTSGRTRPARPQMLRELQVKNAGPAAPCKGEDCSRTKSAASRSSIVGRSLNGHADRLPRQGDGRRRRTSKSESESPAFQTFRISDHAGQTSRRARPGDRSRGASGYVDGAQPAT